MLVIVHFLKAENESSEKQSMGGLRGTAFSSLSQTGMPWLAQQTQDLDSSERQRPWLPSQSQLDFALNS